MKHLFITCILFAFAYYSASSQNDTLPFSSVSGCNMMAYKGGEERMLRILNTNLKYPEQAKEDNISGTVYVKFIVDTNGRATDIRIAKGIRADLDNEAMRAVSLMDEWIVGKQNGKKVRSEFTLPIGFILSGDK